MLQTLKHLILCSDSDICKSPMHNLARQAEPEPKPEAEVAVVNHQF